MNHFEFLGRLTKEPEVRFTSNTNTQVTIFTLAVNRKYKQEGQPEADFFNLTAFGKTAEFISKYFTKGQQVLVAGRIQNRTWEDDKGQKRYATDFIVEEKYFADSKKSSEVQTSEVQAPTEIDDWVTVEETEELPF